MMPRHLPYSLKPEFVRGCTLRCVFCGLRNQDWAEKEYEYLPANLWGRYVEAVAAWRPKVRIEIANRGEPTLHPRFIEYIHIARQALPKAQFLVSTNGDLSDIIGLARFKAWVQEAQDAGVNCFLLDCYTPRRLREFTALFAGTANTFFDDSANPYPYRGPDWRALIIKDACTYKTEDGRAPKENIILHYHNQGGNADVGPGPAARMYPNVRPIKEPLARMCVRPFREFPMWFDGSIPICCDDWGDEHIVGKFPDQSLPDLWDAYDEVRENLIRRDRGAQTPCNRCTEQQGKRFGLELDWFAGFHN
jgi:hypothetical protein